MIPYKNVDGHDEARFSLRLPPAEDTPETLFTQVTYEEFVCGLVKERGELSKNLEHMVIGICGEAGEIADAIKKHTIYGKELDLENVVEELGDLEFYIAGLRQMLSIRRRDTLRANIDKLSLKRYPNGYSDAAAVARADKVESQQPIKRKLVAYKGGVPQAINLPAASVEGMYDTTEVTADPTYVLTPEQLAAARIPDSEMVPGDMEAAYKLLASLEAEAVAEASGLPLAEVTQALQAPELDSVGRPIQVFDHDNHPVESRP